MDVDPPLAKARKEKMLYARLLRRDMTRAEVILWNALRGRRFLHCKFRRQTLIGPYIADFLCMAHHLIIELDGPIHDGQEEKDREREKNLRELGYHVLRFRNEEVMENIPLVLQRIEDCIFRTAHLPVSPSPHNRRSNPPETTQHQ